MKNIEGLAAYCTNPIPSTVLVIALHGASVDKRKSLYKAVAKNGIVVESLPVRDYEINRWISSFYAGQGLKISPEAAVLLAEHAGTDLNKIAVETEKMRKNLPESRTEITVGDIEENIGISRQYSVQHIRIYKGTFIQECRKGSENSRIYRVGSAVHASDSYRPAVHPFLQDIEIRGFHHEKPRSRQRCTGKGARGESVFPEGI